MTNEKNQQNGGCGSVCFMLLFQSKNKPKLNIMLVVCAIEWFVVSSCWKGIFLTINKLPGKKFNDEVSKLFSIAITTNYKDG